MGTHSENRIVPKSLTIPAEKSQHSIMLSMTNKVVVSWVLFSMVFQRAFALKCYVCAYNSATPGANTCAPSDPASILETCPVGWEYCLDASSVTKVSTGDITTTTKMCGGLPAAPEACTTANGFETCVTQKTCQTDGCNAGLGPVTIATTTSATTTTVPTTTTVGTTTAGAPTNLMNHVILIVGLVIAALLFG